MSNYNILIKILDKLREEAPTHITSYHPNDSNDEQLNQARARAYIHLFLKANLGVLDFTEREKYVTDGTNDGGIDGYFIDEVSKSIIFIQSKFRTTEANFKNKEISIEEILKMDIDRILEGETTHENGVPYNGKIIGMQRKLQELPHIAKYTYEVIFLANLSSIPDSKIRLLTSGYSYKIYDYKKTFSELVFPIVSGSFYNYSDLCISVNLSNKSSGAHITYSVDISQGNCDITVLFIPLNEIGKVMYEYKNSILKYNPRSYLTLKEGSINSEIKETVIKNDTNEFALFNNGITILSDETFFNQRIGQKNKAQLSVKNPQIINGGQTAFTLSLLYEDSISDMNIKEKLEKKEVLVKIITFSLDKSKSAEDKIRLIEEISNATNKQNLVNNADRSSNNPLLIASQRNLFLEFGLLLERKRGEFYDGLRYGYIEKSQVIDRGIFMRIAFSCMGYPVPPKKEKQLLTEDKINSVLDDIKNFRKYYFGCLLFSELQNLPNKGSIVQVISSAFYSIISVSALKYYKDAFDDVKLKQLAKKAISEVAYDWYTFEEYVATKFHNSDYFNYNFNFNNKTYRLESRYPFYYRSAHLAIDLNDFYFSGRPGLEENSDLRKKLQTVESFLRSNYLDLDKIEKIRPLINTSNWFDEHTIRRISDDLNIDSRVVRTGIKLITSKDYGYYLSDINKSTGSGTTPLS